MKDNRILVTGDDLHDSLCLADLLSVMQMMHMRIPSRLLVRNYW